MTGAGRISSSVVRVRYAETDKMGVVYYANYLVWFEIGRTDWLRHTGWTYRTFQLATPVSSSATAFIRLAIVLVPP